MTDAVEPDSPARADGKPRTARLDDRLRAGMAALRENQAILAFLIAIFIGRFLLADWNSYWNDEILSARTYGNDHANLWRAIVALAQGSIHPPLYQSVLYVWMQIFGDGETSTRTVSNLFITLAALFLYLIVKERWGRAIAFVAAAGFSVMHMPVYLALETRSYAMTIFLVTLSSWLLLRLLFREADGTLGRRRIFWGAVAVIAANTALMLVHYYNVFWLIAQAMGIVVYLAATRSPARWRSGLGLILAIGGIPQVIFAAIWGPVFVEQYIDSAEGFRVEGGGTRVTPLDLLMSSVIDDNLVAPAPVLALLGLMVLVMGGGYIARVVRSRARAQEHAAWSYAYLLAWAIIPLMVALVVFSLAGVERYTARYFSFALPPVAALVVIATAVGIRWAWRRLQGSLPPLASTISTGVAGLLVAALILPGGYSAAVTRKDDWRGIAQRVVELVERDPAHEYFLAEMAFNSRSRLDYYYARFSDDIRSDARANSRDEQAGNYADFLEQLPAPGSGARVVMVFNHHDADDYPNVLARLDERYLRLVTLLDDRGKGFVVYSADAAPLSAGQR